MRRRGAPPLLAAAGALVAAFAALPLVYLLVRSADGGGSVAWDVLGRSQTWAAVWDTVLLVGAVTVSAVVLGVSLAFLVVRTDLPGRRFFGVAAALPLVIPSYVTALAFIAAVGPGGLVAGATWVFGFEGAWLALTLATYPYVFLLVAAALRRADPALEDAARGLGRTPTQVFRQVTLPVVRPAMGGGAVLVALYAISDFGVVSLMRYDALTRAIYAQYRSLFDRTPAAVLGLLLVVLTAIVLLLEARARGGGRVQRGAAGASRPAVAASLGRWRWPAVAYVVSVLGVALVLPVGTLVGWALRDGRDKASGSELLSLAGSSVLVSALAAVAAVLAALPVAALAVRHAGRFARVVERLAYGANALPGIVIALSLVFFATRALPALYQTLVVLVAAYVVRFLPQALAGTQSALQRVDPQLEDAARGLGEGPVGVWRRVTGPLVAPGLAAGATLVFLSTMKELPVTLLLRPTGFDTLATEVWTATGVASYSAAAVPALLLVLVSTPVVYGLQVRSGGWATSHPTPRSTTSSAAPSSTSPATPS